MDGILLFNKPILWTSHDAVDFIRRCLGQKTVGHAGTLDPLATGLLVVLAGSATKLSSSFMNLDKDYRGTMMLGFSTETQDLEGRVLKSADYEKVSRADVENVFKQFLGKQRQTPPRFSAVRKNGRKLYDWSRRGIAVTPDAREIVVSRLDFLCFDPPEVHFFLSCSKGTYVRSLCEEAGERLGCGAVLSSLARTRVGEFYLKNAFSEAELKNLRPSEIDQRLIRK